MKLITTLTLVVTAFTGHAQVTDSDIVKSTLGKNYFLVNKTLDSLGVWYVLHLDNNPLKASNQKADIKKVYSIQDGKGNTKVFVFVLDNPGAKYVQEIVINYRHDSRQQVEDSRALKGYADFHVGLYSTDFVFKKGKSR